MRLKKMHQRSGGQAPPSAVATAREWARAYEGWINGKPMIELYEEESLYVRKKPESLDRKGYWKFAYFMEVSSPVGYLLRIPRGRVLGIYGAIISPDNKLLIDLSFEYTGLAVNRHSALTAAALPSVTRTSETVAVLCSGAAINYYYWLIDVVSRYRFFVRSGIPIDKYAVPSLSKPYQRETLKLLGIPEERIIEMKADTHIEASALIVPSMQCYTGAPPREASMYVRDLFLKRLPIPSTGIRRMYISRREASYRMVTNEDDVINLLKRYDFHVVQLEKLSVTEQIQLFRSADVIVAPHGAGLANTIFCSPGTKVVEIFCPGYINPLYWKLSDYHDVDYYYLLGEGEVPLDYVDPFHLVGDISVDIERLQAILEPLLGG